MTSFLARMANEATAALSDAYGHVMHGDDAGSSARLVWVVHPTKVPIDNLAHNNINGEHHGVATAVAHAKQDANNKTVGSPGSSSNAGLPSSSYLFTQKFDLGLTFLEINDRAYVKTVDPNSAAERAGIQPEDCVQFACVVGGPQFEDVQLHNGGSGSTIKRGEEGENGEQQRLNAKATKFVLECEKQGMRISHDELRDLFAGCTLPPKSGGGGGSNKDAAENNRDNESSNILMTPPRNGHPPDTTTKDDCDFTVGSNSLMLAESVGGTFEPSKKPHNNAHVSSRRVPLIPDKKLAKSVTLNVTNAARNAAGRCFEGGDDVTDGEEDDESTLGEGDNDDCIGGGQMHRSKRKKSRSTASQFSPVLDTPASPIKSTNVISTTSPTMRRSMSGGTYGDGVVMEQSLYPVVLVFRRTVQRKRLLSPTSSSNNDTTNGRGWSSPGLSLRGSLFGIPSFRMDDECDRAAALIRQLAPTSSGCKSTNNKGNPQDNNTDDGSSTQSPKSVASSPPNNADCEENIEASTIRGMLNHAVALGFVRLSKVVVGVSLQSGSGILVSRLPDGTWSAPSALGVYGLGVGLQFGLEVADFLFIIQTNEGLEHFKRGGNFVVGGNIGAAVVNCGREAYGAASLGGCGLSRLPLDYPSDEEEDGTAASSTFDESTYNDESANFHSSSYKNSSNKQRRQHKSKKESKNTENNNDIAPMVAYAKSQGLYVGVSVDGLKFFTRNDINARTYKFSSTAMTSPNNKGGIDSNVLNARDILNGLVEPPVEAEDLYAALQSVECTHEMTELPRPPEMLRKDSMNDWRYDRSITAAKGEIVDTDTANRLSKRSPARKSSKNYKSKLFTPYSFLSTLNHEESSEFSIFETKFKRFLYSGVSVQHLLPNASPMRGDMTRREERTLWLMLPEMGSLRLGFVSQMKRQKRRNDYGADRDAGDDGTVASSVASSRVDADDYTSPTAAPTGNARLSEKYSVSLTDITSLSQDPNVTIRLSPDDATEHLRILSINDVTGKSLLFLANSNHEAELLFCGLKLLLECETSRLSVRGGVSTDELGGKLEKDALSPLAARGSPGRGGGNSNRRGERPSRDIGNSTRQNISKRVKDDLDDRSKYSSFGEPGTCSSSDESNNDNSSKDSRDEESAGIVAARRNRHVSEGRQMRQMANDDVGGGGSATSPRTPHAAQHHEASSTNPPTYELGKAMHTDIATNISLPLPLAMCRVLFLDSSSPLNKTWEADRPDSDYRHGPWTFPPGSIREFEVSSSSSEQHLISRASMAGAQRTVSYGRMRNRELVRLSEKIIVEQDDNQNLHVVYVDQMPRRGFSAKARLILRSFGDQSCEARVVTEICPIGKNLSNQLAVHKAFVLVLDEMKKRYGLDERGLLEVFLDTYNTLPGYGGNTSSSSLTRNRAASSPRRSQAGPAHSPNNRAAQSSITKSENSTAPRPLPNKISTPQKQHQRSQKQSERPSTPSIRKATGSPINKSTPSQQSNLNGTADEFADFSTFDDIPRTPVTVEVKPLPKIRLDLCPAPREEDEEAEDTSASVPGANAAKIKRKSKSKHRSRSGRNR